ncbi:sigma54 specific transcriptional regulator, Fis family [Chondromyces apiculatus DSM 436]|uniref:Sigma54 specific transcriptional regulator, Fis family n=1 Tax=Chondromyces apiculatus DSM 436 TaxID=1192034 RepID=A0A017TIB7_9BACT|nr:sigma54 specific transcriptional regulator, Fis family [Chondromyces apiculatus DSM 436]
MSRRHAIIHVGPPLRIEDLGSANGTRIRRELDAQETAKLLDTRIQRGTAVEIKVGEPVNLGSTLLVVRRREPTGTIAAGDGKWEPIVRDDAMVKLYALAERVAGAPLSVLLLGETGSGKEVLAEHIHRRSPRANGPFLRLNCAALSESLLESELFGHEKGAFTSAVRSKPGLLETAEKGTVFLDEVGELPASIQVKLLRVLEDRQVMRVGGLHPRPIDVRFVSATNRDLAAEVKKGTFREDLFFRLNGIALLIPPLRARLGEIEPLVSTFAARAAAALGRRAPTIAAETVAALKDHRWPGNVRELRNVIDRAVVLSGGDTVMPEHLLLDSGATVTPPPAPVAPAASAAAVIASAPTVPYDPSLDAGTPHPDLDAGGDLRAQLGDLEKRRILDALEKCAGNQTQAAALLGMPRRTFVARLTAYGIPRPRKRPG